jgi:hypothetical protein
MNKRQQKKLKKWIKDKKKPHKIHKDVYDYIKIQKLQKGG